MGTHSSTYIHTYIYIHTYTHQVLDPAQNHEFVDHYLNLPLDLSGVFFLATANTTDTIPTALLDRMEVMQLEGYSLDDKVRVAVVSGAMVSVEDDPHASSPPSHATWHSIHTLDTAPAAFSALLVTRAVTRARSTYY